MDLKHKIILLIALTLSITARADDEAERIFRTFKASDGIADNSAQSIICTFTGRMTISTLGNINFYDGSNFKHINIDEEKIYVLDDYMGGYHLYYDNNHHLWLKGYQGVSCVNLTTEQYIQNIDSIFRAYGAKGLVTDLLVDENGNLWPSMGDYIVSKQYGMKVPLKAGTKLQDLAVWNKQTLMLWYGDGTMEMVNLNTKKRYYRKAIYGAEEQKTYTKTCQHLMMKDGVYVIRNGEQGGILLHYDLKRRQWREVMRQDFKLNHLMTYEGMLYVAAEHGYFTMELATGKTTHYPLVTLQTGKQMDVCANVMAFDLQGGLWIGTEKRGVLYDTPLNAPFKMYGLNDPLVADYVKEMEPLHGIKEFRGKKASSMLIDSRNWTWVGTPNGLYMYTKPQAEPVVYSTKNGLQNNIIHAIVEDNRHNIWVSTSFGISCVQVEKEQVKQVFSYTNNDNVPNETFIDGKVMVLGTGDIIMQSLDHVVVFNPKDFDVFFNQKTYVMHPKLTKLMVNGVDVSAGDKVEGSVVLDKAITRTKEINLNYDQNSISLTFSALNFARPLQTFYKVRVRELDNNWEEFAYYGSNGLVDRRGLLHLPMLALEPGTYHIELLTSVVPHQFTGRPYEWVVNVNQPWWRTSGLMGIFGLVVLMLAMLNFYVYNKNTRLRMRRDNEEDEVLRRIRVFVERCASYDTEQMSPTEEEIYGTDNENQAELSDQFMEVMLKVIPFVKERGDKAFSMYDLSLVTEKDLLELYELVTDNIHKSPRALICTLRIDKAEELLRTTMMTVEEVAHTCGFVSPNYMIAKFFHKYRQTPKQYREAYL